MGFAVHGLWPEAAQGKSPESCGPAGRVAKNVVRLALLYMPSANLIQHEWAAHGTCTGLSAADYFFDVIQARTAVQIPVQMTSIEFRSPRARGRSRSSSPVSTPRFRRVRFGWRAGIAQ